MPAVLIFAAGEGTRWHGALPKQLIEMHGEPIIGRICRQVLAHNRLPIVITHDPLIEQVVYDYGGLCHTPKARRWLAETMLSMSHYGTAYHQQTTTCYLLGDVVYSQALMDLLMDDVPGDTLNVFGTSVELLALQFGAHQRNRVYDALTTAVRHAEDHPEIANAGKLWNTYRALEDIPLMEHTIREPGIFQRVMDWSTDIDSPALYDRFMREVYDKVDDLP